MLKNKINNGSKQPFDIINKFLRDYLLQDNDKIRFIYDTVRTLKQYKIDDSFIEHYFINSVLGHTHIRIPFERERRIKVRLKARILGDKIFVYGQYNNKDTYAELDESHIL